MEGSMADSQLKNQLLDKPNPEIQAAKKGKSYLKTVKVVVASDGKQQKNEGPPSDSWSWRKYGQKPIKGSPYPRGYYRCSASKGCPAKKQVERCRTDASMLIVTYTSTHNHPGPNLPSSVTQNSHIQKLSIVSSLAAMCEEPKLQQQPEPEERARNSMDGDEIGMVLGEHFHYLQPPHDVTSHIDPNPFSFDLDSAHESLGVLVDEEPISLYPMQTSPKPESNEYDFFDELEELPLSALPFRSFMTCSFYSSKILVQPS